MTTPFKPSALTLLAKSVAALSALLSPLVQADGTALLVFTTDRVEPADLVRRAVILHAGPDNFGNVPTGPALDQYTANSAAATDKTAKTGNAGDRVACGLVHRD